MKSSTYKTLGIVFIVTGMIGAVLLLIIQLLAGIVSAIVLLLSCLAIAFILIALGDIIEALRGENCNPYIENSNRYNNQLLTNSEPLPDSKAISKPTGVKK